eukprot:CAMPEP_0206293426 /NCGR_PEP_ID=MMETSP0106_2-20121207/4134_1 /ASSEMBLY_ACC=CAM_ASM_000206 /TAXON_ID=81532 /ORGANISM="Acanthoeca-like sp., Strain 10tr" /LENGTH=446 /DNA_ID=CAMNT_0053724027 /DNA_START=22 /DNA_END=1362 /DNA_ORIENTATION=+
MSLSTPKMRGRRPRSAEVDLRQSFATQPRMIALGAVVVLMFMFMMSGSYISGGLMGGQPSTVYSIMIDAGSTGSRIHAYHFERSYGGLVLQKELFEQLKPGLSSFKSNPTGGANSLLPLLNSAKEYVPAALQSQSPILLKATAGLRMLKESEADALLAESRSLLANSGFKFAPATGVEIMDGLSEGMFAWVTINYLRSSLGERWSKTAVMLDLGGGSTQIAMDIGVGKGSVAKTEDTKEITLLGSTHKLYLHSFLGYGLMAGRAGTFAAGAKLATNAAACVPTGAVAKFSYRDDSWSVENTDGGGNANDCIELVKAHLANGEFGASTPTPASGQPIYAMSYYFDRAVDAGLISADVQEGTVSAEQYKLAAERACSASASTLAARFPNAKTDDLPFLCMDLCFITELLTTGFRIDPKATLHLAKSMQFNGERVETQWTLGAALHEVL